MGAGELQGVALCSSSSWRCQITRICGPPLFPRSRRRYWIVPSHQIQSLVWSLLKGLPDLCALFEYWVRLGCRRCWWREGG